MIKAVFLDTNGTLVEKVSYPTQPKLIRLIRHAGESLQLLKQAGYELIVIANQPEIAKGFFAPDTLYQFFDHVNMLLRPYAVALDWYYYCPHHPEGKINYYALSCLCRKPAPGLLLQAAQKHMIDLSSSWMIGDMLNDVEAGKSAGCRTILLDNGHETEWLVTEPRMPDHIASDFKNATYHILENDPHMLIGTEVKEALMN